MKNGKTLFLAILFLSLSLLFPSIASAEYVLPYPSFMPGSKIYKAHLLWEEVLRSWYIGNFSQFQYNLNQADKYLVESKTLFEYKQYLLGYQALKKSDKFFSMVPIYLEKAKREGKDINQKQKILKQAVAKHIEVLTSMQSLIPEYFVWEPEKDSPTNLFLQKSIKNSISIRSKWVKP